MSIRTSFYVLAAAGTLALFGCSGPAETGAAGVDGPVGAEGSDASSETAGDSSPTDPSPTETDAAADSAADSPAGGEDIPLTAENATIQFVGTKDDGKHDGGFRQLQGTLRLAGDAVEAIAITVKTESLWADNPKLEGHLKNPDFFEVQAHPELRFASTSIEPGGVGDATHTIKGDLTMLDQTHSIEVPATIEVSDGKVQLKSEFTIDRTRWGMNYRPDQVHKDVQITVAIDSAK